MAVVTKLVVASWWNMSFLFLSERNLLSLLVLRAGRPAARLSSACPSICCSVHFWLFQRPYVPRLELASCNLQSRLQSLSDHDTGTNTADILTLAYP
jgi:hypothetical protein